MTNVNHDVATLTTIPKKTLDKLNDKVLYCICETIMEDMLDEKSVSKFNFFNLFTLYIKFDDPEGIKYRVVPNETLTKNVNDTVKNKLNLLEDTLNKNLALKFAEVYKNIC